MTKAAPGLSAISSSFKSKPPLPLETANMGLFRLSLEGDRLVGRIDMHRREGRLCVRALWPERGVRLGKGRLERIGRELDRIARFCGCDGPVFENGWIRESRE